MENVLRTIVGIGKYFLFVFVVSLFILNPSQAVPFNGSLLAEVLEKDAKVDVVIRGTVTDERGEPIPGVTVSMSGTGIGTATDMDGWYSLSVPEGATLVFSFIGFETQQIIVGNQTVIDVVLAEDMTSLDEVVVVGYGVQKKENLTGSLEVISGTDLANRPAPQTSQLLQGQSPSMLVTMGLRGSEPGSGQSIKIRGLGSITGDASPLVLVDGVEMDMNLVDPSSIENITILKDASASAVYGSRAAFGVILIQTKKGTARPVRVTYSNIISANVPYYVPDMLDSWTYATVFNQAQENAGLGPIFGPEQMDRIRGYIDGTYPYPYNPDQPPYSQWRGRWDGNANVNWTQKFFRDYTIQQKHNINLEGGNEKTQFYTTIGYQDQPGTITWGNDRYKRYNILANVSTQVTDWARFDFSGRFARTERDYPNGGVWDDRSGYWMHFNILWPTMPEYNIDGSIHNPIQVALMEGGRVLTNNNHSRFSIGTELEPIKGWTTNIRYNYTYRAGTTTNTMYPVDTNVPNGTIGNIGYPQTGFEEELRTGHYSVLTAYSQYQKEINGHYFSAMAGYEHDYDFNRNLMAEGYGLITVEVPSISTALGTKEVRDVINHWATQGIFGRLNYNFQEKYLVEFSARYDGSSRFEKGQRWGFFPSASVGYTISNESFWEGIEPYVPLLKLRASYGSLGNQTIIGSRIVRSGQAFQEYMDPNVANYLYLEEIPITPLLGRLIDGVRPAYADMPGIRS
ncbi:MAG TPA: SusC/RagA family TonB-linked outer membrane protein, partial [Cyclobacteriaceae bacterium]|nr:SusC/RagA family TonB-linked outer membrane protein [Cyclobacteriaceae bacterium]